MDLRKIEKDVELLFAVDHLTTVKLIEVGCRGVSARGRFKAHLLTWQAWVRLSDC